MRVSKVYGHGRDCSMWLKDRIAGRVLHSTRSGPKPYLTPQEEKEPADFLVTCSKMGHEKTSEDCGAGTFKLQTCTQNERASCSHLSDAVDMLLLGTLMLCGKVVEN